jgi:hypothetical protein
LTLPRLEELSRGLEDAAERLRAPDLAAQAAVELDRLARGESQDSAPGQEELL